MKRTAEEEELYQAFIVEPARYIARLKRKRVKDRTPRELLALEYEHMERQLLKLLHK